MRKFTLTRVSSSSHQRLLAQSCVFPLGELFLLDKYQPESSNYLEFKIEHYAPGRLSLLIYSTINSNALT